MSRANEFLYNLVVTCKKIVDAGGKSPEGINIVPVRGRPGNIRTEVGRFYRPNPGFLRSSPDRLRRTTTLMESETQECRSKPMTLNTKWHLNIHVIPSNFRLLLVHQKPGHTGEEGDGQCERAGVWGSFCSSDSSVNGRDGFLPDGHDGFLLKGRDGFLLNDR